MTTSSDQQKTRPDVRRNSVDMSVLRRPTMQLMTGMQQNSDAASLQHPSSAACQSSAYDRCLPCFMEIIALMNARTFSLRYNFSGDIGRFFGIELLPDVALCVSSSSSSSNILVVRR